MPDPIPGRRGPATPEGLARSAMNAVRHGLRARRFLLLPEEDPAEFAAFAAAVRGSYAPADAVEAHLVEGIAVAMWRELRADRIEAETMADIPPADEARSCGTDLVGKPDHRASLETALRYRSQAQMELRRAQALLVRHRQTRGQAPASTAAPSEPEPDAAAAAAATGGDEICTNEFLPGTDEPEPAPPPRVGLRRKEERRRRDPMDDPILRRLGRDPDLVLPVPGLHPSVWPIMQKAHDVMTGPWPADGPQPYRRVPGVDESSWWRFQHLIEVMTDPSPGDDGGRPPDPPRRAA